MVENVTSFFRLKYYSIFLSIYAYIRKVLVSFVSYENSNQSDWSSPRKKCGYSNDMIIHMPFVARTGIMEDT